MPGIDEYLLPDEIVNFEGEEKVMYDESGSEKKDSKYVEKEYEVYVTNKRIMLYRQEGWVFKDETAIVEEFNNIKSLTYEGSESDDGNAILNIESKTNQFFLKGPSKEIKNIKHIIEQITH